MFVAHENDDSARQNPQPANAKGRCVHRPPILEVAICYALSLSSHPPCGIQMVAGRTGGRCRRLPAGFPVDPDPFPMVMVPDPHLHMPPAATVVAPVTIMVTIPAPATETDKDVNACRRGGRRHAHREGNDGSRSKTYDSATFLHLFYLSLVSVMPVAGCYRRWKSGMGSSTRSRFNVSVKGQALQSAPFSHRATSSG